MVATSGRTHPHRFLLVLAMILAPFRPAAAHPIHMSFTEARYSEGGATLQLWVRVFANDFAAAAARRARIRLARDSVIDMPNAVAYLVEKLQLVGGDGRAIRLVVCGTKRVDQMLFFCLQAKASQGTKKLKILNSVMTELFDDQVNVVQTVTGTSRASRLFVRGDGLKAMP